MGYGNEVQSPVVCEARTIGEKCRAKSALRRNAQSMKRSDLEKLRERTTLMGERCSLTLEKLRRCVVGNIGRGKAGP